MRYRVTGVELHVHRCADHADGCNYFTDHTLAWMLGNRDDARRALVAYRRVLTLRIEALSFIRRTVDALIARLELLGTSPQGG